ncbi:subtilisin-like serine protease [Halogeometricum borinquense DSM 11551]|uniref:Subtilisin-like serine protease n=2 Tax=Halogeometricum borinquense TaxID=60847 RepID=E4NV10_HALBP|nr:S8 family serine peptidase [Halogeometricum borinquense]ADQ68999.1 subtilisin-like serine protease [Halogeometricum borinquense DSM 11551]ELY29177.1 subtilisin-like serine protease [Halogeometricum borinquense DSM 11551]RYJ08180.1 serine protease [Halogeometricum borinquense]
MFEIRTDPQITTGQTGDVVTVTDIREIHGFPDPVSDDAPTGRGLTVAVMDSGVDETHEVFDGITVEHHNFTDAPDEPLDDVGHGTAVAGLIAQLSPGIEKIVDLRIFGTSGRGTSKPIFDAYEWAQTHADELDTINLSWGARSQSSEIDREHSKLMNAGVQDVVSAGNTGETSGSPVTANDAYGIGAITEEKELTRFSSYNPGIVENPDVVALGKDVRLPRASNTSMGTVLNDDYVKASGTSFSAPIATAAMNLFIEQRERASERPFERTAKDIPGTPRDVYGYIRYDHAVELRDTEVKVDVFDLPFTNYEGVALPEEWADSPTHAVLERETAQETVVRFER